MFAIGRKNFSIEDMFVGGLGSYVKFLTVVATIFAVILYYVPVSRSYFRKGCHILIDLVAVSLKSILNSFEAESDHASPTRVTFPNNVSHRARSRGSKDERRHRRYEDRTKSRSKDGRERRRKLSTVQLCPGRELELRKYLKNSHGRLGESEVYMLKEPRNSVEVKWSKSTIRPDDDVSYLENDEVLAAISRVDESNQLRRRKGRRARRDEADLQKVEDKLRKLRRRIRSIATVPDEVFKQQKETEALEIIDDLLKNRVSDVKGADDVISNGSNRLEHKSRASSRQESPRVTDLPKDGVEDLYQNIGIPPFLNDRVTPVMKKALHWIRGGCPGTR